MVVMEALHEVLFGGMEQVVTMKIGLPRKRIESLLKFSEALHEVLFEHLDLLKEQPWVGGSEVEQAVTRVMTMEMAMMIGLSKKQGGIL
jgi:hypothetical protein